MGVTCPACGTENRSVAKFCIECIGSLPTTFAATEIFPPLLDAPDAPDEPERAYLPYAAGGLTPATEPGARAHATLSPASGFVAARGIASVEPAAPAAVSAPQSSAMSSGLYRTVERRKGLWVSVAAFAIALIIGAAGWMVAGAGGLYIYAFGHSSAGGAPEVSMVTAPAEVTATVVSAVGALAPLAPTAALSAPAASDVVAASTIMPSPQSKVMPVSMPVSMSPAPAPAAVRTTAKPTAAPTTLVRRTDATTATTATGDPNAQCSGLGFFAASRCMQAQCAKAEYSANSACIAVLQQKRLMDEKRNPTMAN